MKKVLLTLTVGLVLMSVFFAGCQKKEEPVAEVPAAESQETQAEPFKAAFVYIGVPGDLGYTYEHERGRKYVEAQLGDKVETTFIENVPEGPDAARIIRQYAQKGYDMIFATSFGYMDFMYEVAQEFPDVYFEHCSGYKTAENMSTYFGRMYQARYLAGLVAGKSSKSGKIGYVGAFPIPEVIRGINAFTIGARKVNPNATVKVVWTNTWYDPVKEREAAVALLDDGCDLITQHQDTTEPQKAAQERGMVSIGYDSDMGKFVGDSVLVSPMWNWGPYYAETIEQAMAGVWKTHSFWGGLKDGVVELSEFSPKVTDDVTSLVDEETAKIEAGEWDVFWGPVKAQDGSMMVPAGEKMSDPDMLNMSVFVDGVLGKTGN
ncbi:BMP family ABC transporter substrate-binding protein [Sediminispirochaeta smaragdinae]|jgi:basic membrane protein A|uniref:Basic membrane lipoprotein n=1 Tax=Sediminispirochaeta smaragdinae (strain DSM 11293 / JCM 15392 / SEBR 4228) TaxID=573413 RepID=E1R8W6_SEDSS|nr:BMP family ABC transporter substrate-binding protein [Sediminispirochaeta smaragdinae]ADK81873.1 basic membrane lipoprotein [Sediminispirochaeta smaragdinae DSM 11293]